MPKNIVGGNPYSVVLGKGQTQMNSSYGSGFAVSSKTGLKSARPFRRTKIQMKATMNMDDMGDF